MATSETEGQRAGEFIISEQDGTLSRDTGILVAAAGNNLKAGAVLGKVTLGAGSSVAGTNTGNGTIGAITVGGAAQVGAYTLKITKAAANAGDFEVIDPQGDVVGIGTVAAAFSGGGLSFTLADGATDFAVGDSFTVTVAAGSGKYTELAPSATDGSQIAASILFDNIDASVADKTIVIISRLAEVSLDELQWPAGITSPQKTTALAQLAALNIIARS